MDHHDVHVPAAARVERLTRADREVPYLDARVDREFSEQRRQQPRVLGARCRRHPEVGSGQGQDRDDGQGEGDGHDHDGEVSPGTREVHAPRGTRAR